MYRSRITIIIILILCCINTTFATNSNADITTAETCTYEQNENDSKAAYDIIEIGDARRIRNVLKKAFTNTGKVINSEIRKKEIPIKKKILIKGVLIPIHQIVCVYRE